MRHVRSITAQAFEREDGLWDIEARLTDTKPRPIVLASGPRAAGEPVHLKLNLDVKMQPGLKSGTVWGRSEEHTSELQSH